MQESFDTLHAEVSILLAEIQLRMGFPVQSQILLSKNFPLLLEHCSMKVPSLCWQFSYSHPTLPLCNRPPLPHPLTKKLQGQAWLISGKCCLASTKRCAEDEKNELLQEAASMFEEAIHSFEICSDMKGLMETLYLMSVVHCVLPHASVERDHYASKFMNCHTLCHQSGFVGVADATAATGMEQLLHHAIRCFQ